ncbi:Tbingi protein [Trypanosoma grayi]|uniref:Tbingi protein n=1 Tax=Trypanosoma grayi TaxID=71804 RepID=UPI0004F4613A|nr:Tbingi protein [Trypanosoma grayi]KEG06618.1 Tbingi protein [Trypanosoma grayi]
MEEKATTLLFHCDYCGFGALSKTGLLSHIRAKHRSPEEPPRAVTPRPTLYCPICLRPMGNAGGLASHMKYKHPGEQNTRAQDPNTSTPKLPKREREDPPTLHATPIKQEKDEAELPHPKKRMRTEASSPTDGQLKNEGAAPLPPERRREIQCLVCLKWFASLESVRPHCRRYHEGHGVPVTVKRRRLHEDAPDDLTLSAFSCPPCGFQCHSKHGLTRHRIASHGFRPGVVKPNQHGQCEETGMHLLSCPVLKSLRCHFGVDEGDMWKLCFMKEFATYLLEVKRLCPQRPSPIKQMPTI